MVRDSENTGVHETHFSPGDRSVVAAIVRAVAAIDGVEPTELPCFGDELSGEGLAAVIESNSAAEVRFPYAGYEITVTGDGTIAVREP